MISPGKQVRCVFGDWAAGVALGADLRCRREGLTVSPGRSCGVAGKAGVAVRSDLVMWPYCMTRWVGGVRCGWLSRYCGILCDLTV